MKSNDSEKNKITDATPLKVLLVEDNPGDARLMEEMLAEAAPGKFDLIRVERLDSALKKIEQVHFEVVLLDLHLPDSRGISTLAKLQEKAPAIPMVLMTGLADESVGIEAVRKGAQDYLVKGQVNPRQLVSALRHAVERKRAEAQIQQERDTLEAVTESSNAHVAYLDRDFNFILVNSTYEKGSGHTRDELIGRNHFEFFPNPENETIFTRARDGGKPVEFKAKPFEFVDQPWRGVTYWDWTLTPIKEPSGTVTALVLSLVDITGAIRSRQLSESLNEINAIINSTLNFDEVLQRVVRESAKAIGSESAIIALRTPDHWEVRYSYKYPQEIAGAKIADDEMPHVWLAASIKKPVVIDDIYTDERVDPEVMQAFGLRSVLVLPLLLKEEVIGFISFNYHSGAVAFSEDKVEFAKKLGASVTLAIQNSELYTDERKARRLNEALNDINGLLGSTFDVDSVIPDVLSESNKHLGSESAVLLLRENAEWLVKYVHGLPSELTGMRFRGEEAETSPIIPAATEPVICDDAYNDKRFNTELMKKYSVRSFAGVPLSSKDGVIGSLSFHFHSAPNAFNEIQVDFAKKLAASISLALQNAQLFDSEQLARRREEERAKRLEVIHQITNIAVASLETKQVAESVMKSLAGRFGIGQAVIGLADEEKGELVPLASFGYPHGYFDMLGQIRIDGPLLFSRAFRSGEPAIVERTDLEAIPVVSREAFREAKIEIGSYVILQLKGMRKALGVISLTWPEPRKFTDDDIEFFTSIANEVAVGLENARLYEAEVEAQRKAQDELMTSNLLLAASNALAVSLDLHHILESLSDVVLKALDRTRLVVNLIDRETNELTVAFSRGELARPVGTKTKMKALPPYIQQLILTKKPLVIDYDKPDMPRQARAEHAESRKMKYVLLAPLTVRDEILGFVAIDDPGTRRQFTEREISLVEAIAAQAAVAIENAKLHDMSIDRAQTFELVMRMGSLITSELRMEQTLRQVMDYSLILLDVPGALLLILDSKLNAFRVAASEGVSRKVAKEKLSVADAGELGLTGTQPVIVSNAKMMGKIPIFAACRREGYLSAIAAPIFVDEQLHSILVLQDKKHLTLSDEDIAALKLFNTQVSVAIKNAERYEAEHHIAQTLQRSLLPGAIAKIRGLEVRFYYQSASEEAEVGGDFYDFFELPVGLYGIVMGDVAGKGIEVAADTARVRYLLRDRAYADPSPNGVLEKVNNTLYEQGIERFITLTYGVYDPKTAVFKFSNAGNPYPYMVRGDHFLELTCVPLSIIPGQVCDSMEVRFKAEDTLIMCTDGLTEARYKGALFGEEGLRRFVRKNRHLPLKELIRGLVEEARAFAEGNLTDDVLVIGIRKK
jgi:PAS domain S-box-containing protein